jgi:hypothetical protein
MEENDLEEETVQTIERNFETYIFDDFDHEMNYCVIVKDMMKISNSL